MEHYSESCPEKFDSALSMPFLYFNKKQRLNFAICFFDRDLCKAADTEDDELVRENIA